MEIVDLRSDTVTQPTPAMREAMAKAEVGDDVFGEDPTLNRLEALAAQRVGHEAGLFVPSGTMGNLAAVLAHCQRGDEAVMGHLAHTFLFEAGGISARGGVFAHTLPNQPDGTLRLEDIQAAVRPDDPHRPIIREIIGQINRLDAAVKDLLIYAKPKPPTMQPCDLNTVIGRVVKLLRGTAAFRRVEVRFEPTSVPLVPADENQIEQLVINLLVNAAHACEANGGTIDVGLADEDAGVRLIVADTGEGMDEKTRQRAFEPFFTTKARGTGLGLSICRKIVDAHGADITLTSAKGAGTKVMIDFRRVLPP